MPTPAPPTLPDMPNVPQTVVDYLRRLTAWAQTSLDGKIAKDEATARVLLTPIDQKSPSTVYAVTVNSAGVVQAHQVPLGGGAP